MTAGTTHFGHQLATRPCVPVNITAARFEVVEQIELHVIDYGRIQLRNNPITVIICCITRRWTLKGIFYRVVNKTCCLHHALGTYRVRSATQDRIMTFHAHFIFKSAVNKLSHAGSFALSKKRFHT